MRNGYVLMNQLIELSSECCPVTPPDRLRGVGLYSIVLFTLGLERSLVQDADVGGIATENPKILQAR
jgi:hypothetical protein